MFCPNDPTHNSACDNHVVAIMRDNSGRTISVALPAAAFARVTNVRCLRLPEAAAHLVATPPVLNQGPHNNATPDTNVIKIRRVLLMPPADTPRLLTEAPLGTMTKAAFHQRLIQPGMGRADANVVNAWTQVGLWFCASCTNVNTAGADVNCLAVTAAAPANPAGMLPWVPGMPCVKSSWSAELELEAWTYHRCLQRWQHEL